MLDIKSLIRSLPDVPQEGVVFRDITTLLGDAAGFRKTIDDMIYPYSGTQIDRIAGIEARGFIIGGAIAHQLSTGFLPVRKKGKLPWKTIGLDYQLEYGHDRVEIHVDAVEQGQKVLLVDDLIATGGTAVAAVELLQSAGAEVIGCSFVIDLPDLGGSARLREMGCAVSTLVSFEGD